MAAKKRYRLLFELGRGGMATVYLAVARGPAGFSKLKVVKRLHSDAAYDTSAVEMLLAEARITARLNHPNVIQVNEVVEENGEYLIEMEYLEGQPFDAVLGKCHSMGRGVPVDAGLWVLTQVLAGLHYAHELRGDDGAPMNVVHRDVSPHNVFVTYEGVVKLLDFGIAKASHSSVKTETGVLKGKVAYMAPEQVLALKVDRRADVFAVGAIMWHLLAGQRLWSGLGDIEILTRLVEEKIPAAREVKPEIDADLDAICTRALAPRREDRFPTAAAFGAELEQYLASRADAAKHSVVDLLDELFAETRASVQSRIGRRLARLRSEPEAPATDDDADEDLEPLESLARPSETRKTVVEAKIRPRRKRAPIVVVVALGLVAIGAAGLRWRAVHSARDASPAPSAKAEARCATNASCGAPGVVCRAGRCISLGSEDCHPVATPDEIANDETLWFGVMFQTAGGDRTDESLVSAVELARQDIMRQTNGLPPASGVGASRPVGLVECDDSVDYRRAAKHLVFDVRVPAIIGFKDSEEVIDLAPSLFMPNDVLTLATRNSSPYLSKIPQPPNGPRMLYRTVINTGAVVPFLAALTRDVLEPRVRKDAAVPAHAPIRVALARTDNSVGLGLSGAVFQTLRYNGRSVGDNAADFSEHLLPLPPGPERAAGDVRAKFEAAADAIVARRPHLVFVYNRAEDPTALLLDPIEARWPRDAPFRPIYVLIYADTMGPTFFDFVSAPRRRGRVLVVTSVFQHPANVKFAMHFNEKTGGHELAFTAPGEPYDAFYVLAYASFCAGKPITGSGIARGVTRLQPAGVPIDVGPDGVYDAFRVLRDGANIDLQGAASSLDFDPTTGDPRGDFVLLCPPPALAGRVTELRDSGLRYDAHGGRLAGRAACP